VAVERWTPERRRQLTRDALIDAAASVFARRGFHGASLDEIADTAGFTRGAIYKNFADKEDLFLAVSARLYERGLQEFSELLGAGRTLKGIDVAAVAAKWRELQTGDPDFFVLGLEFNLYLARNPAARERAVARRHEWTHLVSAFIEQQAAAAGTGVPMPAEDLANIFLITSAGFTMASLTEPELARLYEPFLELFIRALAASPPPTPPRR
jgi:AcrR family transcriptional regulator